MAKATELKQAGFSDIEIAAHQVIEGGKLEEAGFSQVEIDDHFGVDAREPEPLFRGPLIGGPNFPVGTNKPKDTGADLLTQFIFADKPLSELLPQEQGAFATSILDSLKNPGETMAKETNALYMSSLFDMPLHDALFFHDSLADNMLNQRNVPALKMLDEISKQEIRRKSIKETLVDGYRTAGINMVKGIAGLTQAAGETGELSTVEKISQGLTGPLSLGLVGQPEPEVADLNINAKLAEWGRVMTEASNVYLQEHPEERSQIVPGRGFFGTAKQHLQRPETVLQGAVEAAPMLLEAYLGSITGTAASRYIGWGGKLLPWMGRVQGIATPIIGQTYADIRQKGTPVELALPQAFLTGQIEGIIEEWTLGQKVKVFKGAGITARKGIGEAGARIILGGAKAHARGTAEEATQQISSNFWNMVFSDPDQKIFEGVGEAAATGGFVELFMTGNTALAGRSTQIFKSTIGLGEKLSRVSQIQRMMNDVEMSPEHRAEVNAEIDRVAANVIAGREPTLDVEAEVEPTDTGVQPADGLAGLTDAQIDELEQAIPEITPEVRAKLKEQRDAAIAEAATQDIPLKTIEEEIPVIPEERRIITTEVFEAAKARIKERRGRLTAGIDPSDLVDAAIIGGYFVETGVRKFSKWSGNMINEFGEAIQPHLRDLWVGIQTERQVKAVEVAKELPVKSPPVKAVKPTKIVSPAEAGPSKITFRATEDLPGTRIIADPKVRRAVQTSENKLADLKTKLEQAKANKNAAVIKATETQIAKKELAIAKLKAQHEVKITDLSKKSKAKIDSIRKTFKDKEGQVASIKQQLVDYARENLPLNEKGKLLAQVKNVKTVNQLNKAIDLADRLNEQFNQRVLRSKITKTLKKTKPKRKAGITKGRFTADIQDRIESIKKNLNNDRQAAREKIFKNIEAIAAGAENAEQLEIENENLSMQGIKGMTSGELQQAIDSINQIIDKGKTDRQAKREVRFERRQGIRERTFDIITGGKGLKPGTASLPASQLEANENFIDRIANWQYGWDELLDKLSRFDPSAPFQSDLSKFGDIVHASETVEAEGIETQIADFTENFKRIFDTKTNADFKKAITALQDGISIGPILDADGVEITIEMTTDQAIKKYIELQDPTLQATFIGGVNEETGKPFGMRWTPEIIQEVNDSLTAKEKAFGDWQLSWYRKYYPSVNKVFRDAYNINMPFNPFYSPIGRDVEIETPEPQLLAKEAIQYASTINGSLKSRQGSIKPLRFNDSTKVLLNHITKMEHFKAWNESVGDLRSIFGTPDIRKAIQQYQGPAILRTTDGFIDDMARGGISRDKINRVADTLRVNFTKSILGLKPLVALKQIPSVIAYVTEMSAGDLIDGVIDFWKNPIENYNTLIEKSPDLRKRFGQGFERDIRDASNNDWVKKLTGSVNFTDVFFSMIKAGDKFATVQGSWAKYKSELKSGKSDAAAIAAAVQSTNRTQPTSSLSSLSAGQRGGSFVKLLTMFQNQPNKYFRIIATNARALRYHRGSQAKAATNIAVAWVVLPMIFQFISDAFRFRKEKQLQALLLGPINNLLIAGSLAKTVIGWSVGEMYDFQGSPVLSTTQKAKAAASKVFKEDPDTDDIIAAIEFMAEAIGQATGVPTPAIIQAEKAIRRKEPLQLIFSEHSLKSDKKKRTGRTRRRR